MTHNPDESATASVPKSVTVISELPATIQSNGSPQIPSNGPKGVLVKSTSSLSKCSRPDVTAAYSNVTSTTVTTNSGASGMRVTDHRSYHEYEAEEEEEDELEQTQSSMFNFKGARKKTHSQSQTSVFLGGLTQKTDCRGRLANVLRSGHFEAAMGVVILANICLMVYETNENAPCAAEGNKCDKSIVSYFNEVFLFIYTLEFLLRLFVLRSHVFASWWNILDFFIVLIGYIDVIMTASYRDGMPGPSLSLLKICRVFRLVRAVRIFQQVPELYGMLRGFISAMQSMCWGFIMINVLLLIFGILSVELIHPVSQRIHEDVEYCHDAFASVWFCMIMFFQTLVAGDSWGYCAIPVIKEAPWTFIIFAGALISVQLGFMNLILAVIVERATRARDDDENEIRRAKHKAERKASTRLLKIFAAIDSDQSGTISLEELLNGFDENEEMQKMFNIMDISRADLGLLFDLLDTDDHGELSYQYIIDNLRMCHMGDSSKTLMMLHLQATEIVRCIKRMVTGKPIGVSQAVGQSGTFPSGSDRISQNSINNTPGMTRGTSPQSPIGTTRGPYPTYGTSAAGDSLPVCIFEQEMAELKMNMSHDFSGLRESLTKLSETMVSSSQGLSSSLAFSVKQEACQTQELLGTMNGQQPHSREGFERETSGSPERLPLGEKILTPSLRVVAATLSDTNPLAKKGEVSL